MIENMAAVVNSNNNNNNLHTQNNNNSALISALNNNNNNSNESNNNNNREQQGQCEFNFLKRELDRKPASQQINNNNTNNNKNSNHHSNVQQLGDYEEQHNMQPPWKKRHIEQQQNEVSTTTATPAAPTPLQNTSSCFDLNNFTAHTLHDFEATAIATPISSDTSTTSNSTSTSNHHQQQQQHSNDLTFNLIGNSTSFINDLFGYDANLLVPVTANLVTTTNYHATHGNATHGQTDSTATTTEYSHSNDIDDDVNDWQSNDLLDLDHRYNAGLQAELNELSTVLPMQQSTAKQGHTTDANAGNEFLVPQIQQQQVQQHHTNTYHSAASATPTLKQRLELPLLLTPQHPQHQQHSQQQQHAQQHPDSEPDLEDKNLSWLLNFKFDEFPHLSPDLGGGGGSAHHQQQTSQQPQPQVLSSAQPQHHTASGLKSVSSGKSSLNAGKAERATSPKSSTNAGKRFKELVMEVTGELDGNDMIVAENVVVEDSAFKAPKKPPFTYTELIEYALEDKGELTVSGIYQWISDRFPYYKSNDDRWKNSVRHNLSINPHFRKGHKAPQGAGHLWTISSGDSAENVLAWEHKKQRLDLFFKMESMNRERIQKHQQQLQQQHLQEQQHAQHCNSPQHERCGGIGGQTEQQSLYNEAAAAAAAITQEMLQHSSNTESLGNTSGTSMSSTTTSTTATHSLELPYTDILNDEELRKTAGQILNGIHRDVEVQAVNSLISTYQDVLLDNEDYLNPIHKDVAVSESGLRHCSHLHNGNSHNHLHSQYYVTDIDPMELGIQMSHQVEHTEEEEVLFNDDFNLNYFGYNPTNDIVA